ncbi:hypothetical protein OV203_01495 [Nannocystis sp. ILAH1]|uniref:hypothetical protein n=1 Tax=Nannocystis sp. ILAH1 TaxID=2996789 RepID=UPI00226E6312|nr:hypothetical protein [Nannocystis sp. ILAH1]MCY0985785.1 hypothetical protein [Nannocystis sp. ILAH1]
MHEKIIHFARSFPTLADAPLEPWDPVALDTWAAGPAGTSGSRHAAACVLAIWNRPPNPVGMVREALCTELRRIREDCDQRLDDREETEAPMIRRRIAHAREKMLAAWRAYQLGELVKAREAAGLAAELAGEYTPVRQWLAEEERTEPVAQVLRRLANAETWRVGTFNVVAAMASWDEPHRAAFLAWARHPWWPS